jgi:hypothetical protein
MKTLYAWWLGFIEHINGESDCGRTWPDDQDCNEAYDRGWNFADFIRRRSNG